MHRPVALATVGAHKVLVTSSALHTVPMVSNLPFSWRDLTPVAMLADLRVKARRMA